MTNRQLVAKGFRHFAPISQTADMFRGLVENAIIGVYVIQDYRFLFANQRLAEMLGYERRQMTARLSVFDIIDETDHAIVREQIQRRLRGEEKSAIYEVRGRRSNGDTLHLEVYGAVMRVDGRAAMIGVMLDVTLSYQRQLRQQRQYVERLQHLATHDALTGLANRALLLDRLNQATAMARHTGNVTAVLLFDLDKFKVINDSLGHPVGDALLKAVACRIQGVIRKSDTVARLGGDEFVLMLPDVSGAEVAAKVANKVLVAISAPFAIQARELHVDTSIGISLYPRDGEEEVLLKNADLAMYQAKREGGGKFHFYSDELDRHNQRYMELETELRHALERGELSLAYQPKVNLHTQRIVGAEALLRWQHPVLGNISPAEFIPIAEVTGLIIPIGEWVLQSACAQNRAWQNAGMPAFAVSVNLSARQFRGHNVLRLIEQVLERTGLAPKWLDLELTESVFVQYMEETVSTLSALRALGVGLSMDDFGTGYSSLNYLNNLPFDTLKLDRSFIRDLNTEASTRTLTFSIITLAHNLGLKVVAEGIETEAQYTLLRGRGCDEGQGYYWSAPLAPEDFFELVMRLEFKTTPIQPGESAAGKDPI